MKLEGKFELAIFLRRPNRFLAHVFLENSRKEVVVHVPDPGRLIELLKPKTVVLVRQDEGKSRKTKYTLVAIKKEKIWVNIESIFTNKIFEKEFKKIPSFNDYEIIRSEYTFGNSRFDFLMRNVQTGKKALVEVKGVTLVENQLALFPDAPTKRGVKHVRELQEAVSKRWEAFIVFIIKREDATRFSPNKIIDPQFTEQLISAYNTGVKVVVVNCDYDPIRKREIKIKKEVQFIP